MSANLHPFADELLRYLDSGFEYEIEYSRRGNGAVQIDLEDGARFQVIVIQTKPARDTPQSQVAKK